MGKHILFTDEFTKNLKGKGLLLEVFDMKEKHVEVEDKRNGGACDEQEVDVTPTMNRNSRLWQMVEESPEDEDDD